MNKAIAFVELEQRVEQLVSRYSQLKDENDALKREVGFLRQENQRLLAEQKDVEDKVSRILQRVQMQDIESDADYHGSVSEDDFSAESARYESSSS